MDGMSGGLHTSEGGDAPDGGAPKGPRNPWHPPSTGPRRPAGLEDLLRSKGGGGDGPPRGAFPLPQRPGGKSWTPLVLGGLALLWLLGSSSHQLASNEQGIVTSFGKYSETIGPGMNVTLPWPFQRVRVEDVTSIRRDSVPDSSAEMLMLTSDQSLVDLSYIVRWRISNLKQYAYQLKDPKGTVIEVAEAAMRASVAEVKLRDVMGGAGRAEIESNVRARMQAVLDAYHAGVMIQGVDIKKADPPAKVNAAFQQVQAAQQDYNRDVSNAQAFAQQVTARAEADAAQFNQIYAQYKLAPEVTRRRMYYDTMERVLMNNDKVIAPTNGVNAYLPLPAITKKPEAGK
jgi:membrane protease subunit HflK